MKPILTKIWVGWKRLARALGRFQVWAILTVFYFLVLVPLGLIYQLTRLVTKRKLNSTWQPYKMPDYPDQYFRRQG